jgi:hypothetical protein
MIIKLSYLGREIIYFPERQLGIVHGKLHPMTAEDWEKNLAEIKKLLSEQKRTYQLQQIDDADEGALLARHLN